MEWISTKDRLPTVADGRPIKNISGTVSMGGRVFVVRDSKMYLVYYKGVNAVHDTLWCRIPEPPKVWRKPTLDDLKNGPVKCRWYNHSSQSPREGLLSAIDVQPSAAIPYYLAGKGEWVKVCEIEVTT